MSVETKSCYIYTDKSLPSILLPDLKSVFVGRSVDTKIADKQCSRNQVRLFANYQEQRVIVQQLGNRPCGFNGYKTIKGEKYIAKHGDKVEILFGQYPYFIEFNPPPATTNSIPISKKRSLLTESTDLNDTVDIPNIPRSKRSKLEMELEEDLEEKKNGGEDPSETKSKVVSEYTVSSDTTDVCEVTSKAKKSKSGWDSIDNDKLLIYTSEGVEGRSKIAAYDMDGTLICTKSGLIHPKNCDDWQLLYPEIPMTLKKHYNNGYKIVIFTNQSGLGRGKYKIHEFKDKVERIIKRLGVPIQAFIAPYKDIYRKPATGMWDTMVNFKNDDVPVDMSNSFYVGDAAGRPKDWAPKKKKDHSLADRLLALNLNLKFETPEEHFFGRKPVKFSLLPFDPKVFSKDAKVCDPHDAKIISDQQEVIIMVGSPGSGKSHFVKTHLASYQRVNRDTLGSWQKCVAALEEALSQGKSVVIDNTNPDPPARQRYILVAKKRNVPVRCFVMKTGAVHCRHNNKFRELTDHNHEPVSDIILNSFAKNFIAPDLKEGFSEVVNINFVPKFYSDEHRSLYEMHLLEK